MNPTTDNTNIRTHHVLSELSGNSRSCSFKIRLKKFQPYSLFLLLACPLAVRARRSPLGLICIKQISNTAHKHIASCLTSSDLKARLPMPPVLRLISLIAWQFSHRDVDAVTLYNLDVNSCVHVIRRF